ncbi:response regulator [Flavobacterium sp. NST-5]|uniref:Response regulator n=1 Tax=Flavobacterium ichthyis TaxID=2698827 RepID=A0ABW9Z679_9FLAO|nr:response regulator transcription factor [Flavobacterium ichthyis]NBL64353.1 response regulator [Flavobacterium ichthyis]
MIKVAVFEDNIALREQLMLLLHQPQNKLTCVGGWENCLQVEKIIQHYQPDIVLMDIDMPEADGFVGLKYISQNKPKIPVIMLTVFEDDKNVFESICLGAKGYLLKKSSPEKIIESIHDTLNGGSSISPEIARKVMTAFASIKKMIKPDYKLTLREKAVLQSLVDGNSYKMIASELDISINTVRQFIRNIYDKLQVHSMNEAVSKAIKQNIL